MPSIISKDFRIEEAARFVDTYADGTNKLYMGIGNSTPWANEMNPPAPTDSISYFDTTWNNLEGVHLIDVKDFCVVVPRINWVYNTEYFEKTTTQQFAYDTNCYVVNSQNHVYLVNSKSAAGTLSTSEPTGVGVNGIVDTGDGYTWKFLYDLNQYDVDNLMSPSWLPVNYGANHTTTKQTNDGDLAANKTLDGKYVMVRAIISDTDLPVNITYRQISLIKNPLLANGSSATAQNYSNPLTELTKDTNKIIYIDNRPPVTRLTGQYEEIKIVIEF